MAQSIEPLSQLLIEQFGTAAASAHITLLNQHHDYWVLGVVLERPFTELVVKLAGPESTMAATFDQTAQFHQLIRNQTQVPVAEIIAVDVSCARFPWRYLIQNRIQGQAWAQVAPQLDRAQKHDAYQQLGHAVAELHHIHFAEFGVVNGVATTSNYIDALIQHCKQIVQRQPLREWLIGLVMDRRELFESVRPATLCHEDLHHHNILFRYDQGAWRLVAILDLDKAWAGHAESDLARLEFWDDMMGDGFKEVYYAQHPLEPGDEQRRPLYQLLWCLEYDARTPRHIADTQRVCEQLGVAPPTM